MTANASAHASDGESDPSGGDGEVVESYDDLLATLDVLETEALRKVKSGRVYDPANERVRIKWIRIAKDIVAEKRKVAVDRDLDELADEVDRLKEQRGVEA